MATGFEKAVLGDELLAENAGLVMANDPLGTTLA